MYLSRILHTTSSDHRLVMRGFPETKSETPRADWGILYRAEGDYLLVQSAVKPDWSDVLPPDRVQTKQIEPKYEQGASYRFRLAFARAARNKGRDRVIGFRNWLDRRDLGGEILIQNARLFDVRDISGAHRVYYPAAVVDGTITVTDIDRLMQVIRDGVGRGRAYGLGLMSVA